MDFIAKVFVLALKCQNSTVISSAKRGVFENMGAFSHHRPLLWREEAEFQRTFFEPVVSKIFACSEEKNFLFGVGVTGSRPLFALPRILVKKKKY